jgi:hypothetical protein
VKVLATAALSEWRNVDLSGVRNISGIRFTVPVGSPITIDQAGISRACLPNEEPHFARYRRRDVIAWVWESKSRGSTAPAKDEGVGEHVRIRFQGRRPPMKLRTKDPHRTKNPIMTYRVLCRTGSVQGKPCRDDGPAV